MGQESDSDHRQACQVPCQGCFITELNVFTTTANEAFFFRNGFMSNTLAKWKLLAYLTEIIAFSPLFVCVHFKKEHLQ